MRIVELDIQLSNQIAAGEVIERPASVVKELVENSLDAGATHITIEILQGGQELIRVRDNGAGIHPQDLTKSIARHATSKIKTFDDLERIGSLGFRGEALASIAAVSRLKIASCQKGMDSGFCLQAEGGHIIECDVPIAHPIGTTVDVRDLFYNTPARRKFLRAMNTEFSHIETMIQRLALSRFDVGFVLKHQDKIMFETKAAQNAQQKEQRVLAVMRKPFMQEALAIEFEAAGMKLSGWVALPTYTRAQNDMQFFYINGRYVRDKLLMHAAREAYCDILFHGRQPVYVLFLTCNPAIVDVNVHPTKHEVRFRDSRSVHDFVRQGLKNALMQVPVGVSNAMFDLESSPQTPSSISTQTSLRNAPVKKASEWVVREQLKQYTQLTALDEVAAIVESNTELKVEEHPLGKAIAQLHDIYILAQNKEGLVVVDMHAAHERILYEKLKKEMESEGVVTQLLLVPHRVDLNSSEMQVWEDQQAALSQCGLVTEQIAPNTVLVREFPAILKNHAPETLLRDIVSDHLTNESSSRLEDSLNHWLATMACRSAVHAHRRLTLMEMDTMLRTMEKTQNGGFCNHGRPSWKIFSMKELDSYFLRGK